MQGLPSKLIPHESEIRAWKAQGISYRKIADLLEETHGLRVSYNSVYSFLNTRDRAAKQGPSTFWQGLPLDLQQSLLQQITVLWSHGSTSIEGNTLTLGETTKILELGLTIHGKPLKDHEEVYGHAKAIDLIYAWLEADKITREDLFDLHRCVMQKSPIDALRPIGNWKLDYNGTTGVVEGKPLYMEYASPLDTPALMTRWLKEMNRKLLHAHTPVKALNVYTWVHLTFVRIHPFFDGNGRMARLLANLPLLKCGYPPILISPEKRPLYIDLLWEYERAAGILRKSDRLLPPHPVLGSFKKFLKTEWQESLSLVEEIRARAELRATE